MSEYIRRKDTDIVRIGCMMKVTDLKILEQSYSKSAKSLLFTRPRKVNYRHNTCTDVIYKDNTLEYSSSRLHVHANLINVDANCFVYLSAHQYKLLIRAMIEDPELDIDYFEYIYNVEKISKRACCILL